VALLPLRIAHGAEEPGYAAMARLSYRALRSPAPFGSHLGLPFAGLIRGNDLELLSTLSGIDADALKAASPRREAHSRIVQVGHAQTVLGDFKPAFRRWCPACFREDRRKAQMAEIPELDAAYHRRQWNVQSILTCTDHGQLLASSCPACRRPIGWAGPAIDRCACGADLAETEGEHPFDSSVDKLLLGLIGGERAAPEFLVDCRLDEVHATLFRLGACGHRWADNRIDPSTSEILALRERGLCIARAGGSGFDSVLDSIVNGAPSERRGLTYSYGWVWRSWLAVPGPNPAANRLRKLLLTHAERRQIIQSRERDGSGLSLKQARRLIGAGHARGRRLLSAAGLIDPAARPGVAMTIDADRLVPLATGLMEDPDLLDARRARAALGIGPSQFRALVAAGIVQPTPDREPKRYSRAALLTLVATLCAGAPISTAAEQHADPLPAACRNASIPLQRAVRAVLDGHLRAVGTMPSANGLASVLVLRDDVAGLRAAGPLTVAAIARKLRVHYDAARDLVALGAFKGPWGCIDPTLVTSFSQEYCTTTELAALIVADFRHVSAWLASAGVWPVFGPPSCRQAFYNREQAMRTILPAGRA